MNLNKSFPYIVKETLEIQSHIPEPPISKREFLRQCASKKQDESRSPAQLCFQNPPLPGSDSGNFVSIKIIQALHVGYEKRSQILRVRREDSSNLRCPPTNQDIIAKIYDPLYHDYDISDDDPFRGADYDYTHECAAYTHLSDLQGTVIPKFFGSYTLKLRFGDSFRLVRLVLLDWINGPSMNQLKPTDFSRQERQEIMKQIVDAESSLYTKNVSHEDLRPQNVVLDRSSSKGLRVVIIDLGKSVIGRSRNPSDSQLENRYLPGVAISPLLRWNVVFRRHGHFQDWIDWPWQSWLEEQYKDTEATITEEQRAVWKIYDWMLESKPPPS
ncbi:hypothetical protein BDV25DRAFT_168625 [Aspergillus avenaceus]|uniref:EKC/KEOPS complex subunit BUD32 n=1 Tax=Aspergillus avenaceus TaxID=36643 RepID=A0A5N6U678_ASPAV|nr:hypothetical protein BDV25DRAFT_168625 [Aspergillus avenaceus]